MDAGALAGKLSDWIKDKVTTAGCKGAVLGMSGGIDSSVVAALCIKAFPENTLGLIMPCHSNEKDKEHAEIMAKQFSIPTRTVVLDDIYDEYLKILPEFKPEKALVQLARANLKARLRMITLYYTANQLKYLVIGSGNRSELTVGYFTKHGDSGVDILPLGNLVKKEVRELARFLKIPPGIIDKAPSAGLWAGQTDEAEMGITYEALDNYILTGKAPEEVKKRIERMRAASVHKCTTAPIPEF
ncbi:MAG: NAD(+) synthase [Chloroflexi bacterium RBG_13_51_18]|nr:MAG: NAD(+) synthase [Chloroflexi bacterium RBG_13_51_18]